jgi:hypothetical protein
MARPKRPGKRRLDALTGLQVIELTIGPPPRGAAFADDATRRQSWRDHRDELVRRFPTAWARWQYDQVPADLLDLSDMNVLYDDQADRDDRRARLADVERRRRAFADAHRMRKEA